MVVRGECLKGAGRVLRRRWGGEHRGSPGIWGRPALNWGNWGAPSRGETPNWGFPSNWGQLSELGAPKLGTPLQNGTTPKMGSPPNLESPSLQTGDAPQTGTPFYTGVPQTGTPRIGNPSPNWGIPSPPNWAPFFKLGPAQTGRPRPVPSTFSFTYGCVWPNQRSRQRSAEQIRSAYFYPRPAQLRAQSEERAGSAICIRGGGAWPH